MRQRGVIIAKEAQDLTVRIQDPASVCGSCKGCMRLTPERPPEDYVIHLKDSSGQYQVGDEVIVDGDLKPAVKALGVLYGIPFAALFVGYGLARVFWASDPVAGLGGIVGLLLGAAVSRPLTRRYFNQEPRLKIISRACS